MNRHASVRYAAFSVLLPAIGCSSDGKGQEHGPVFVVDAGSSDAPFPVVDGAIADGPAGPVVDGAVGDAATDSPSGGGCSATIGIVAGGATTLHGATSAGGAAWNVAAIANGSALSAPAIVPQGAGFHAVVRAANNVVMDTVFTSTWSAAATVAAATTRDRPALAAAGAAQHLVYSGSDSKLYHGTFTANAWDLANDPVGGAGLLQDFGPSAAGAAAAGTTLVVAFDGNDHFLYDRSYVGASWQPAHQQPATSVYLPASPPAPPPTLLALTGGAADLLVVFLDQGNQPYIYSAVRDATTKTWSAATPIDTDAATNDAPALAAMPGGRAVLTWRGTNGMAYFNTYDPSKTPAWKQHAFLVTSTTAIASPPTVATGACGDDAIAAYPLAGGAVQVTRLRGAAWSAPETVGTLSNLTFASIATSP